MASALCWLLLLLLSCLPSPLSSSAKPHALVLPVKKDQATHQYVTRINSRTPLTQLNLVVDLGGRYLWVDCDSKYISSSYRPVHCNTPQCGLVQTPFGCGDCFLTPGPGCSNHSCSVLVDSPKVSTSGELGQDVFVFPSVEGSSSGPLVSSPNFMFSCGATFQMKGLLAQEELEI